MIKVEGTRRTIQHLEGGIVREILVRDGTKVQAGQVLMRLDDSPGGQRRWRPSGRSAGRCWRRMRGWRPSSAGRRRSPSRADLLRQHRPARHGSGDRPARPVRGATGQPEQPGRRCCRRASTSRRAIISGARGQLDAHAAAADLRQAGGADAPRPGAARASAGCRSCWRCSAPTAALEGHASRT